ncbi:MAG: carboxypeptidase regulatory-like domain-containing protein [Salinibacter sp.]
MWRPPFRRTLALSLGLLLAALAPGLGPTSAVGQDTAILRVVVTSADDGAPLQRATVVLEAPVEDDTVQAGITNEDGYLELRSLAPGRYVIGVSHVGYAPHRDTLTLEAERRIYGVELPVSERRLAEVTIETRRGAAHRTAGLQTIRPAETNRIPTPGPSGDLASYLQTLPGVVSVGDRGGQLYIRGGAPTQNRTLVDGLPIVRPFHISSFYSAFPQSIVQSVDLYAGGFGAQYGEATSSVLDVQLRPGNMQRYGGAAAIGPHLASVRVEGPIERGTESFLVSGRYSLLEQTADPLFGQEASIGFYDVTGRYSFQRDDTSCNITAIRTHDEGSLGPNENRELSWSNTVIGGRCLILATQYDHAFSVRGGYSGFENSVGTAGSPEQRASRWRTYLMLNYDQRLFGYPVDFGARITAGQYSAEIDEQFVGREQFSQAQAMVRLHWSMNWTPSDRLTVTPSVAGRVTYNVRPSIDPRLRLSFRPDGTDQQEWSLAAGLYHQIDGGLTDQRDAGTVFTLWRPPPPSDPLPRALHGIVGYRQRLGSLVEVSLEGYTQRLQHIPVAEWTPEAGTNTETALANGIVYGADARVEIQRGPFYGYLGYGWSTVTYEAATEDLGAWVNEKVFSYAPAHDRRHQLSVVSSYEILGITTSVSWQFGTGRPYTQVYGFDLSLTPPGDRPTETPGTAHTLYQRPYGARLPAYHRLDVSLERSFEVSDRLTLDAKLGAINLYNRSNVFYYDVDTLQRVNQSPLLPYVSVRIRTK